MRDQWPGRLILVDDAAGTAVVVRDVPAGAGNPVLCRHWDVGSPEVREISVPRSGADGVIDATARTGAGSVTLDLAVFGDATISAYALTERLTAMTHPGRRPYLLIDRGHHTNFEVWRMALRGQPFSISYGPVAAEMIELTLNFVTVTGYFESPVRTRTTGPASAERTNLFFPFYCPFTFSTIGAVSPTMDVQVGGSAPTPPVLYIYGPCTDPVVHLSSGEQFGFKGLVLEQGRFVEINMGAGTVVLDSIPTSSVYHLVDWSVSTFWRLAPGQYTVRYIGTSGEAYIQWCDRRFTI